MKPYSREEAEKLIDELRAAHLEYSPANDAHIASVHSIISRHAIQNRREIQFWELSDKHSFNQISNEEYFLGLIDILTVSQERKST